ncbi:MULTISPECIES: hypothetical protein [Bacillus]|uniref:Fibronectin type III domain protein n=4 Tax=Bacillus cereus group TaxID=86661 RepID=A0A9W4A425_BACTO|nr:MULTISPECIES: hypothetical protein [Bacillus]MDJ0284742.1 hypothetical protein [Bacillus bombysepticus]BAR87918.1 fibronectin type III domain protein [Bacillus thuringiensis serovar tolworthi]AGE81730.1 hypothetical protein HD73_8006 [Bacillus thuringiensis serovar kurstaki str. HD73]AHZ55110.1 hypothetical protein YBT1520_34066 [Bacillus thuringiensis serovar kurstaki str. YBT-1520]AIE37918.1 hypothetical protein BTK_35161 [Bacillus thuringiensis serovar kurstaki str. HD-1]
MEMPKITLTYNLADVANGLTNWLGAYWPIIAFSVAIPLTFLVAFNTKDLFTR